MHSTSRSVFAAGIIVSVLIATAAWIGLLNSAEWYTQDVRFRHARLTETRLSDQIRLVAIDDRAIGTIGRWPWHRDLVAAALDEIARSGARTIATDLLFTEPEGGLLQPEPSVYDKALAAAVRSVPTVLAVHIDQGRLLDEAWQGADGRLALSALTAALASDVTADAAAVAAKTNLTPEQRERFLARPSAFKKYALWESLLTLRRKGQAPADLAAFRSIATGGDTVLGEFAEELPVAEAFDRDRSFGALSHLLIAGPGQGSPLDEPPIALLAVEAGAIGYVNSMPDADGQYRRVHPTWASAYGAVPQLGLAAAMLHQRQAPSAMRVEQDAVIMPDGWRLPLSHDEIYVDWPTRLFEPIGQNVREEARQGTGVVAIGRLINVAHQRTVLARQEGRYREVMQDIARLQNLPPEATAAVPVSPELRKSISEQGEFLVGKLSDNSAAALEGMGEDERRIAGLYREWWRLDQDIPLARDVIATAERELHAELQDKLVFVGWMSTGAIADMINTVYGPRTPGVYFHAAIAGMALEQQAVTLPPDWVSPVSALVIGLIVTLVVSSARLGAGASTAVTLGVLLAYVGLAGVWAFASRNMMLPLAAPLAAGGLAHVAGLGTLSVLHQRARARITRQFRARVSSQLVDLLVQNPDALSVRGELRTVSILFGDLAGFTTISEKLGSEAVVSTLNLYMGALAKELSDKRAYVNKFLGDGLLAFWSAFGPEPEQCDLALSACLECQRQVTAIGKRPDRAELPTVSLRLGVATGVVTIGDCGAPPELNDYTVIGDAANLAARLESANKQFGTAVLIDGGTYAGLKDPKSLPLMRLGRVVVVGQSHPVDLYTLIVDTPADGWIDAVGKAVDAFERGDSAGCSAAFDDVEKRYGTTKLAVPYRQALKDPEDARDGVLRLRAK